MTQQVFEQELLRIIDRHYKTNLSKLLIRKLNLNMRTGELPTLTVEIILKED